MASFFTSLVAPFRKLSSRDAATPSLQASQPGPFSTGTHIESQTPARRRHFWSRNSPKLSINVTSIDLKPEKPARAEKLGTITGVFVPTTLNVMSILMYLRVTTELLPGRKVYTKDSMGLFWDSRGW